MINLSLRKFSSNKIILNNRIKSYDALANSGFDYLKEYSIDSKLIGKIKRKKEDPEISPILIILNVIQ